MKVLDDIYCGITYDIPTEKECRKALRADEGWKSYHFDYGNNSNRERYEQVHSPFTRSKRGFKKKISTNLEVFQEDSASEYDEEEHNLLEEVQRKEYDADTGDVA